MAKREADQALVGNVQMVVMERLEKIIDTARTLSPRRRRWAQFLRDLPLDPDHLPNPLPAPGPRDFIICGSPRSGTTLACAMLYQPPQVVSVMEPWDGMRFRPAELFMSLRHEIERTGRLSRGRLDIEALSQDGRVLWCREGSQAPTLTPDRGYVLGVKWPAYWRFLEFLPETKFVVCLRHPVEVIASYKNAGGRLLLGLNYDTAFNRAMNTHLQSATKNLAIRRVLLFEYVHSRILPFLSRPNVFVVRYERWFSERSALLNELGNFLGVRLGPGHAAIRRPGREPQLTTADFACIRRHCTTASAIGYRLDDIPEYAVGSSAGRTG